jgi:hypothetical protein
MLISLVACVLPVVAWFARNYFTYGFTTSSHNVGGNVNREIFLNIITKLQAIHPVLIIGLVIALALSATVLAIPYIKRVNISSEGKKKYSIILITFIAHLLGILVLSAITRMDELGMRLLTPSIAFLVLALLYSFNAFAETEYFFAKLKTPLIATVFVLSAMATLVYFRGTHVQFGKSIYPIEKKLWSEKIANFANSRNATHFYSQFDLNHQLYCNMFQRIIFDEKFITEELVLNLKSIGNNPFYLYKNDCRDGIDSLDKFVAKGILEKETMDEYGFSLYYYNKNYSGQNL